MPRAPSSQPRSASAAKAKDSSRRVVEPLASVAKAKDSSGRIAETPLEVMPISVWNPPAQSVEPRPSIVEYLGKERLEADGDEDSLFSNAELTAGAISSILRDSNLKNLDALTVEECFGSITSGGRLRKFPCI